MALSLVVIKKSVSSPQEKFFKIVFNLKVSEDTVVVIDKDFYSDYRPGDNISNKVASITAEMQAEVDKYKAEQVIFNSSALNTAVTNISGGLIL